MTNRNLALVLPLDCLSVILSYCEIKEVISRHCLVHRSFLAASRLESTWDELFRTCNLDSFFALQSDLARCVPEGRQRAETIAAVAELRASLEEEVKVALREARAPSRKSSFRNSVEDDTGEVNISSNAQAFLSTAPPNLRSQTFLLLLDAIGVPDVVKLSDFVTITTLCCQLVEYLNTGRLGVLNSENSFFSCWRATRASRVQEPEDDASEDTQTRAKRGRGSQTPLDYCNQERRQRLQHTLRSTLRPGFLCDPFSQHFDAQNRLIELDVPSELLVLLACIGGQDMEVVAQPHHFVAHESPASGSSAPERTGPDASTQGAFVDTLGLHQSEEVGTTGQQIHYSGLLGSTHFYDQHHNRFMLSPAHCLQAYQHQKDEVNAMMEPLNRASQPNANAPHGGMRRESPPTTPSPSGDTCHHFPLERVFPFATSEVGGRVGVVIQDMVLVGTTSIDLSLTSAESQSQIPFASPVPLTEDGVPAFRSSTGVQPTQVPTVTYKRGTVLLYSISRNPNNAFVVAPSLTHFLSDLINGCAGFPAEFNNPEQPLASNSELADAEARQVGSSGNTGRFFQRYEPHPRYGGIVRNPTFSRWTSHCITEGVEVTMSPAFLPDQSRKNVRYCFTYQCTLRFLYATANNPGPTCQLDGRKWELKHYRRNNTTSDYRRSAGSVPANAPEHRRVSAAAGGEARPPIGCIHDHTDEVEGKGVIGAYPLLLCSDKGEERRSEFYRQPQRPAGRRPSAHGGETPSESESDDETAGHHAPMSIPIFRFQYSSCAEFQFPYGEMSGTFTFVPGTLSNPLGPPFQVNVAPFICEYREDLLKSANSELWPQPKGSCEQ